MRKFEEIEVGLIIACMKDHLMFLASYIARGTMIGIIKEEDNSFVGNSGEVSIPKSTIVGIEKSIKEIEKDSSALDNPEVAKLGLLCLSMVSDNNYYKFVVMYKLMERI